MKLNFGDFARKWQFPVMFAAGAMPVPVILCVNNDVTAVPAMLIVAAIYVFLALLCIALPGKVRVPTGILSAAGILAAGTAMLPMAAYPAMWIIPTLYAGILLGGLHMGGWSRAKEPHPLPLALCLIAHMLAQVLVNADRMNREVPIYEPVTPVLTASFLVFGALGLLMLNRTSLLSAVNGKQSVPTAMRRTNRILTLGLMAIVLLCAAMPAVIRAIETAWSWLMIALLKVIELILKLFSQQATSGAEKGQGTPSGMGGESSDPSLWSQILLGILLAIAAAAALVLIFFALRILWRKLKQLVRYLIKRLNEYMIASSEDYVDEIADTRAPGQSDRMLNRLKRRTKRRRVDEGALSPKDRIRYRYLTLLDRHPEWTADKTARENLSENAASLYEKARYSEHEITGTEAEAFMKNIE